MLFTQQIWADSWQSAVGTTVSSEYVTNPLLTPGYYGGVWRSLFVPSYALDGVDGANEIKTGLAYQIERTSNQTLSPDRQSPAAFIDWLRKSEMGDFDLSSKYAQIATRDSGVDATGVAQIGGTRTSKLFSGIWNYSLSEQSLLSIVGSEEYVSYNGGYTVTSGFVDYDAQTSSLKYSYNISERSTPFLMVTNEKYSPVSVGTSDALTSELLGWNLKGENTDWSLQAGRSQDIEGKTNFLGSVEANYKVQFNTLDVTASHLVLPSGLGGFACVDEKKLIWRHDLNDYNVAVWDFDDRVNSQLPSGNGTTIITTVSIEHSISTFWNLKTYYTYRAGQIAGSEGAFSNMLGLSFNFTNPDF